jgi:tRNA-dihydrouridine synthase
MREQTGCDAVLVARGACGNPWIFRELAAAEHGLPPPPPLTRVEWMGTVLEHVRLQIEHRTRNALRGETPEAIEGASIRELRRHLLWYTRGRRGGVHFRRDADKLRTVADVTALLERHFPPASESFELDPGYRADDVDE